MQLTVGTDSTWSLRAWICSQLAQLNIEVNVIDLTNANYKSEIFKYSKTGLVPSLNEGTFAIHDSLAIAEYFNECSGGALYPQSASERALARSLCSELHSGFINIRSQCPFSLDPVPPLSEFSDGIRNELTRIEFIFELAQLPYMFDSAGVVDAFYCILAFRLRAYGINLQGKAGLYQNSLLNWSNLKQAINVAQSWKNA
ncbi:glutathione S-transferase [Thalassotalea euphylliae]|uniref:Glutathione S-transferase n=1 Tax=Thalassotalea euphylliae TaxID=1655234 RepID=A0A3E0TQ94_9GAMM|nr:glutathione S-transferase N-terminal domain-containing protein [Thalassotalea euphylliae]REL26222.1 glutathione S-transferase [Thalassotalea euphylliae]